MKVVLFGKNGQLGSEFQRLLPNLGETRSLGRKDLDIGNIQALQKELNDFKPDLIINASAYTAVDAAESDLAVSMQVNAIAPGVMSEWARKFNAVLIHYSTDFVFDGEKGSPYTENDPTRPLNVYGQSKLAGEENIMQAGETYLILRTSWVYSVHGNGFVRKVLEWAHTKDALKIVSDQVGSPTWAYDLAWATYQVILQNQARLLDMTREKSGIYHLAGSGYTSRYEWAKQIIANDPNRTEHLVRSIEPVPSSDFPTPATRPSFSALDCSKFVAAFKLKMPEWNFSLQKALRG